MKFFKILLITGIGIFVVGCQCPEIAKKKFVEKKREEILKKKKEVPVVEILKPVEKPKPVVKEEKGKATPEEIEKVVKGEEIPPARIPKEKKFVKPEGKLAEIFQNIYFDFDKYNIRPDARKILVKIGNYLLNNPDVEVLIEGNCDERGTREYNLVLGEQRALSARKFLIGMGVSPKRLYTISYGEDNPADPRHNEEAWAKNRRCEFKIAK